jgi:hypothetical protein
MPPEPSPRVIAAHLEDVRNDLDAFAAIFAIQNRLAVFHLQQAAEKLVRAVRLHRGLVNTKDHDLALLVDGQRADPTRLPLPLPPDDVWRPRLVELEWLSSYATAYRYPTSSGSFRDAPSDAKLLAAERTLRALLDTAQAELLSK